MRLNRWLLFGVLLACGIGVALAVLAWWPTPGVTKANFDRIEVGMTRAEVEAIFGGPPGAINTPRLCLWGDGDDSASATIDFDEAGRVAWMGWNQLDDRSSLRRKLDWLLGSGPTRTVYVIDPSESMEADSSVLAP